MCIRDSYYPGAKPLHIKLLFGDDGKIYGGQVVGGAGADKRADVLAVAMRAGMDVRQLAELEPVSYTHLGPRT